MRRSRIILYSILLSATGCVTPGQPPPQARESDSFHTFESGFHIVAREGIVRYQVTLEPKVPREEPLFLRVRFENPADPDKPFVEEMEWPALDDYLFLKSPPLSGLEAGKIYRVEIGFFNDAERTEPRDTHEVFILSNIDTRRHGR